MIQFRPLLVLAVCCLLALSSLSFFVVGDNTGGAPATATSWGVDLPDNFVRVDFYQPPTTTGTSSPNSGTRLLISGNKVINNYQPVTTAPGYINDPHALSLDPANETDRSSFSGSFVIEPPATTTNPTTRITSPSVWILSPLGDQLTKYDYSDSAQPNDLVASTTEIHLKAHAHGKAAALDPPITTPLTVLRMSSIIQPNVKRIALFLKETTTFGKPAMPYLYILQDNGARHHEQLGPRLAPTPLILSADGSINETATHLATNECLGSTDIDIYVPNEGLSRNVETLDVYLYLRCEHTIFAIRSGHVVWSHQFDTDEPIAVQGISYGSADISVRWRPRPVTVSSGTPPVNVTTTFPTEIATLTAVLGQLIRPTLQPLIVNTAGTNKTYSVEHHATTFIPASSCNSLASTLPCVDLMSVSVYRTLNNTDDGAEYPFSYLAFQPLDPPASPFTTLTPSAYPMPLVNGTVHSKPFAFQTISSTAATQLKVVLWIVRSEQPVAAATPASPRQFEPPHLWVLNREDGSKYGHKLLADAAPLPTGATPLFGPLKDDTEPIGVGCEIIDATDATIFINCQQAYGRVIALQWSEVEIVYHNCPSRPLPTGTDLLADGVATSCVEGPAPKSVQELDGAPGEHGSCALKLAIGYTLASGSLTLTCNNGHLITPIIMSDCSPIQSTSLPQGADLNSADPTTCARFVPGNGGTCVLLPKRGYIIEGGSGTLTCNDNVWSRMPTFIEIKNCPIVVPPTPVTLLAGNCTKVLSGTGETCVLEPATNYTVSSGSLTLTCTNGHYSPFPVMAKNCAPLTADLNGLPFGTTIGTATTACSSAVKGNKGTCELAVNTGYTLFNGSSTLICDDGTYSQMPVYVKDCTVTLPTGATVGNCSTDATATSFALKGDGQGCLLGNSSDSNKYKTPASLLVTCFNGTVTLPTYEEIPSTTPVSSYTGVASSSSADAPAAGNFNSSTAGGFKDENDDTETTSNAPAIKQIVIVFVVIFGIVLLVILVAAFLRWWRSSGGGMGGSAHHFAIGTRSPRLGNGGIMLDGSVDPDWNGDEEQGFGNGSGKGNGRGHGVTFGANGSTKVSKQGQPEMTQLEKSPKSPISPSSSLDEEDDKIEFATNSSTPPSGDEEKKKKKSKKSNTTDLSKMKLMPPGDPSSTGVEKKKKKKKKNQEIELELTPEDDDPFDL